MYNFSQLCCNQEVLCSSWYICLPPHSIVSTNIYDYKYPFELMTFKIDANCLCMFYVRAKQCWRYCLQAFGTCSTKNALRQRIPIYCLHVVYVHTAAHYCSATMTNFGLVLCLDAVNYACTFSAVCFVTSVAQQRLEYCQPKKTGISYYAPIRNCAYVTHQN